MKNKISPGALEGKAGCGRSAVLVFFGQILIYLRKVLEQELFVRLRQRVYFINNSRAVFGFIDLEM